MTASPAAPRTAGVKGQAAADGDTGGRCDESRLYAAAGDARAVLAELRVSRPECFEDLFKGRAQSGRLLSSETMLAVAREARQRVERWDGTYDSALASMAAFMKAGYLVSKERRRGAYDAYAPELDRAVIDASRAMLDHPRLWQSDARFKAGDSNNWRMAAYFMVRDMALLLDSVREHETIRPVAQAFFERYARTPAQGQTSLARFAVHPLLSAIANLPLAPDFEARLKRGEFDGLSAALNRMTGVGERFFEDPEVFRFVVRQTGYFLRFERTRESALRAVAPLLDTHERLSPNWSHAAYTLKKANLDCRRYNFCRYDEELRQRLFPRRWRFDRGDRVFESSLSRAEVEPLYYATRQVEAQFRRVTGVTTPVARDPNRKLTLVIYPSRQAYRDYQIILDELSVDNGGIYIESLGKLFTFQRSRQDSWLSLEELVRHEYTHYLGGRYLREGLYGSTALDDRLDRMPWFDEGLAEFLTGATRERIDVRANMVRGLADGWPRSHRAPDYLMDFAYSDGWKHYLSAALWFNHLQQRAPVALQQVFSAVRRTDAAAFDRWVTEQGTLQAAPFKSFVGEQVGRLRGGELNDAGMRLGVDWLPAEAWQESDPLAIERHFPAALHMRCRSSDNGSESVLARFACQGVLPLAGGGGVARDEVGASIDRWTSGLARRSNNFLALNCAPGEAQAGAWSVQCEGPLLRRDDAARAASPLAPAEGSRLSSPSRCLLARLTPGSQLLSQAVLGRARLDRDGWLFYYRDSGRQGQVEALRIREMQAGRWHDRVLELDPASVEMSDAACWQAAQL
ncbi:collagenase [Paludibacterium yongneupense]|uniref:collagenase n=1 Tax=Paludibacterium yongneupense TaxID=400061 RepID=UPI000415F3D7|nr:collagenase [Paludibacterium yongneupense]